MESCGESTNLQVLILSVDSKYDRSLDIAIENRSVVGPWYTIGKTFVEIQHKNTTQNT